jgi:hypothetical protein
MPRLIRTWVPQRQITSSIALIIFSALGLGLSELEPLPIHLEQLTME